LDVRAAIHMIRADGFGAKPLGSYEHLSRDNAPHLGTAEVVWDRQTGRAGWAPDC